MTLGGRRCEVATWKVRSPTHCLRKKEHQGKAYRRFREFMKLDELDDLLNMIEKKITYPCRAGEDGMWAKKNRVKPDAKA